MTGGISPEDLDFHSELTLETLLNAGGKAPAGYLKEQVGVDQTQQIHYRVDEKLAPLGFVEDTGETEKYNGQDSKIYRLTADGEEYALEMNLDLSPELHRGQLEREIDQLLQNINSTRQHAKSANTRAVEAHERIDSVKSTVDGWGGQMDSLQSDVERVDSRLTRLNDLITDDVDREQELKDLQSDVEDLDGRLRRLESQIGDIQAAIDGYEEDTLADLAAENRHFISVIWDAVGVGKLADDAPPIVDYLFADDGKDDGSGFF